MNSRGKIQHWASEAGPGVKNGGDPGPSSTPRPKCGRHFGPQDELLGPNVVYFLNISYVYILLQYVCNNCVFFPVIRPGPMLASGII